MGTFNVLELCRALSIKRLVFSSSASVYGNAVAVPMEEDHPFNNRTLYGATKIAGEQLCRAFHEMYRLNYVGLRYMNVYGPRQDYKSAYTVVIMKILDRLDQGLPPLIFGDGAQSYDFIYVEDAAAANICAMKAEAVDEFYNVGMGVKTSINELTHLILEITGSSLKPQYEPQGMTFVTHRVGSTEKAVRDLGFEAKTGLHEGLEKLIAWRRSHKDISGT
jgi:UDP-glucose 4-epimerase